MFPATERSVGFFLFVFFFPPPRVPVCATVYVCVYILLVLPRRVKLPPRFTQSQQSGGEKEKKKCNVDKPGTQRPISADEIIPP